MIVIKHIRMLTTASTSWFPPRISRVQYLLIARSCICFVAHEVNGYLRLAMSHIALLPLPPVPLQLDRIIFDQAISYSINKYRYCTYTIG